MMSEGYVTIALGKKYEKMALNLKKTLRANGDERELFVITERVLDKKDKLWKDCNVSNERYNCYPKITLDRYLPFEHNIFLDTDMLCLASTENMWDHFKNSSQFIQHMGLLTNDKTHPTLWNNGLSKGDIYKTHGFKIARIHGAFTYFRKSALNKKMFKWLQEDMWFNYRKWTCGWMGKRGGVHGRSDQIMYTLAYAKFNLKPLPFYEQPFITNLHSNALKQRHHYQVKWRGISPGPTFEKPITFGHCSITRSNENHKNYKALVKKIIKE